MTEKAAPSDILKERLWEPQRPQRSEREGEVCGTNANVIRINVGIALMDNMELLIVPLPESPVTMGTFFASNKLI